MANLSNINNYFVVDTTGKVAIGDVSAATLPTLLTQLTLYDNTATASLIIQSGAASGKKYELGSSSTGNFQITDLDAGLDRLIINSSGNVGLETTNIRAKLSFPNIVDTNGYDVTSIRLWDNASTIFYGLGVSNSQFNLRAGSADDGFAFWAGENHRMQIEGATGNVGIGETSPAEALTVVGTIRVQSASGDTDGLHISSDSNGDALINAGYSVSDLKFATADVERIRITSAGALEIRGTATAGANKNAFITNTDSLTTIGSTQSSGTPKDMAFWNGAERMRIQATTGNVGIGTSSITNYGLNYTNLDVSGSNGAYLTLIGTNNTVKVDIAAETNAGYGGTKTAHPFIFRTDDVERMRIDSSGIVTVSNSGAAVLKLQAGTNNSASLRLINDAHDWDVNCQTNDKFAIYSHTDATERLVILPTSGNVGIGTNSPDSKLHVESNSATGANFILESTHTGGIPLLDLKGAHSAQLRYKDSSNVIQGRIDFDNSGTFNFIDVPNNSSTLYLKTGGNVGIGTTSPNSNGGAGARVLHIHGPSSGDWAVTHYTNSNTGLAAGDGTVVGVIGSSKDMYMFNYEDSNIILATNGSEKLRITSGGVIQVKNGSTLGGEIKLTGTDNDLTINGQRGQVVFQIAGTDAYIMDSNQLYPTVDNGRNLGTASLRYSVVYSANGVSTSDETLKENIKECDLGIDFIDSLKPKSYNLKDLKEDNDAYGKKRYGLIAQDILQTELKDSVFGEKDGEYGLSYNDLIAPMIKAIQELKAEIELLKNK